VAIGQRADFSGLFPDLQGSSPNHSLADPLTLQTRREKVFAGGNLVAGPQSVIEALAQGKEAAVSIDRFLKGETLRWGRAYWDGTCIADFPIDLEPSPGPGRSFFKTPGTPDAFRGRSTGRPVPTASCGKRGRASGKSYCRPMLSACWTLGPGRQPA